MSQSDFQSRYRFTIQISSGMNSSGGVWEFDSTSGMTDTLANQMLQAIRAITPPAGVTLTANMDKQDVTDVSYTTSYTTNPISFT